MIPTVKTLANMLGCLDWNGHVELPQMDLEWLAREIRKFLIGTPGICGICGKSHTTTIRTTVGAICADCIEDLHEDIA
jgi:hypothetical protein